MNFSHEPMPPLDERYRIEFSPRCFAVLQAVAGESIALAQGTGVVPRESDRVIINFEADKPYLQVPKLEDVAELARRFEDFYNDTDRAETNIALEWPPEIAQDLQAERLQKGEFAHQIAGVLSADMAVQQEIDQMTSGDSGWLI